MSNLRICVAKQVPTAGPPSEARRSPTSFYEAMGCQDNNLTSYTAQMVVANSSGTTIATYTPGSGQLTLGGSAGTIAISLSGTDTTTLGNGNFTYKLAVNDPSGLTIPQGLQGWIANYPKADVLISSQGVIPVSGSTGAGGASELTNSTATNLSGILEGNGSTVGTVTNGTSGQPLLANASGLPSFQNIGSSTLIGSVSNQGQGMFIGTFFDNGNCSDSVSQTTGQNLVTMMSSDGISWTHIRPWFVYSPSGEVRDPSWYYDGTTYWCAYTRVSSPTASWGLASSTDLINWTHVQDIDESGISQAGGAVTLAWSPEFFVDNSGVVHIIVALGHSSSTMQLYETHPSTPGSLSGAWSSATILTGSSLPSIMIDPFVLQDGGGTYYVFYKNDSNKYIEVMTSSSLTSGYTVQGSSHWMSNWAATSGNGWEGPSIVQVNSNTWYMFVDSTGTPNDQGLGYQYSVYTGSNLSGMTTGSNWSALTPLISPFVMRHGTVKRVQDLVTMRNAIAGSLSGTRHPAAMVTGTTSVSNNTTTALAFATLQWDDLSSAPPGGFWSSGSNTKLTANMSGMYSVTAYVHWSSNNTGNRIVELRVNGSTYINGKSDTASVGPNDVRQNVTVQLFLDAGDYMEVAGFQTSGGALSQAYCNFSIARIN